MKIINFIAQTIAIVVVSIFISYLTIPYIDRFLGKLTTEVKELEKKTVEQTQINKISVDEQKEQTPIQNVDDKKKDIENEKSVAKDQKSISANENICANDSEVLLLDLTLNLMTIPEPVRVERLPNGSFVLPESLLNELNIIPNTQKVRTSDCLYGYAFDNKSGFKFKYDSEKFVLDINVPYEVFARSVFDQKPTNKTKPEPSLLGSYMNYQAFGTKTLNSSYVNGLFEPVIFGKIGSLSNSFTVAEDKNVYKITRGDSFFQKDLPESLQSLVIGDTSNSDGQWSRAAHYFGVRWSRNYETQPGYIYAPNPILSGSASIPSVVDVYINNQKTFSQKVNPGPFDITHLPIPDGAGKVNLIVKDILGNEQVVSKEWYQASSLLAKDEKDFSVETGFLRKDFGIGSSRYANPFA